MKILKSLALATLLVCGHAIYAMNEYDKENSEYMAKKENIESKIALVKDTVASAQKQISKASPQRQPAVIRDAFATIQKDLNRIVPLSVLLNKSDRQQLFHRLHDTVVPLYQSYQRYVLQYGSHGSEIDGIWMDILDTLNGIIIPKR